MRFHVRFGSLADLGAPIRDVRFTLQERTCSQPASMSAKCHKETLRCDSSIGFPVERANETLGQYRLALVSTATEGVR